MTSICVVIVSFNTCELLRGCLESLRGCALPLHVVVVENGSRDGSAAMARACFPEIELIALDQNIGFAAGTNVGLRRALSYEFKGLSSRQGDNEHSMNAQDGTGITQNSKLKAQSSILDYVLLLNPDTVVHPGAIMALAAFLDAHPRVGAVGPRLLNTDGSVQPAAFRFPTLAMTLLDLFPPGQALPAGYMARGGTGATRANSAPKRLSRSITRSAPASWRGAPWPSRSVCSTSAFSCTPRRSIGATASVRPAGRSGRIRARA